jgi:hypothetical protein
MNKLGLLLAGAAVFDLGVVVASSHAAAVDYFLKLDSMHTASSCVAGGGTVVTKTGDKFCQSKVKFSDLTVSSKANAGAKAPAKLSDVTITKKK